MKTLREYIELIENAESTSMPTLKVVNQYDARDPNDEDFFDSDVVTEFELLNQNGDVVGQAEYHSYYSDLYIDGKKVNASHPLYFTAQEMALGLNEGIVDTVRKANYKRLANRSFDKAYDAHQDSLDSPKTPAERRSARAEFNKQYDKGTARMKKADELEEDAAEDVAKLAKEMRK